MESRAGVREDPSMPDAKSPEDRIGAFRLLFGFLWLALVILVPAAGVWVSSSLAAYRNGPVWLVCLAGPFCFPFSPSSGKRVRRGARSEAPARIDP